MPWAAYETKLILVCCILAQAELSATTTWKEEAVGELRFPYALRKTCVSKEAVSPKMTKHDKRFIESSYCFWRLTKLGHFWASLPGYEQTPSDPLPKQGCGVDTSTIIWFLPAPPKGWFIDPSEDVFSI